MQNKQIADAKSVNISNITAIDAAIDIDRAFIWGGTRSGKTYFCKQLAHSRLKKGDMIFAIDPKDHDPSDPWPEGVVVVGQSEDYESVENFWNWLENERNERGKDMANIRNKPFILILFDEINVVLDARPEFQKPYLKILRLYAQYRIGLFAIGQTDDVKSIGLKGLSQIKECFEAKFAFNFNKFVGERISRADLKDGNGMVDLMPYKPVNFITGETVLNSQNDKICHDNNPPFNGSKRYDHDETRHHDRRPLKPVITDYKHKMLYDMHCNGESFNEMARVMFGDGKENGRRVNQIKNILRKYGVDI